jgi:hypothetical protein
LGEGRGEGSQNSLDIFKDLVIPEPDHAIACRFKPPCPKRIGGGEVRVLPSVDFNDEARLFTEKIDHIALNRNLPSKFESCESPRTQEIPELLLRIG